MEPRAKRPRKPTPFDVPERALGTWMLFGEAGLDHSHLRALLSAHGWRELPKPSGSAAAASAVAAEFVWAELEASFRFDPRSYGVRCVLKNVLFDDAKRLATDKGRLHAALQQRFPAEAARFLAKTRLLRDVAALSSSGGEVLIVRPVGQGAWAGNGIFRVATDAELQAVRAELLPKCPNAIASEYVVAPLLWQGRKMHLRMYWLVCAQGPGTEFRTLLWERGKILTAAKPYTQENLGDKAIHDTHAKSTPRNLFFPEDFAQELDASAVESILAQMRECLEGSVAELLRDNARPYNESLLAYEVFGCDFLVTAADHRVVLMEINERVGFQPVEGDRDLDGRYATFTREYYAWVYENAIGPMIAGWHKATGKPTKLK